MSDYAIHLLILIAVYASLAQSLNLVTGYTGMLTVSHAAFFGTGAYVSAILQINYGWPFLAAGFGAVLVSSFIGIVIAAVSLRLRGSFFVLFTFAFQILFETLTNNLTWLTGGPAGISGIPQASILGIQVETPLVNAVVAVAISGAIFLATVLIARSPFGRVLMAIREDEQFVESLGKDVNGYKITVFSISAGMAALVGCFFASYVSYVDPTSFTLNESIFILSVLIVGGAGTVWGPLIGAVALVMLPELLRSLSIPGVNVGNLRQITYGLLVVVMMYWRPQGLFGAYSFGSQIRRQER